MLATVFIATSLDGFIARKNGDIDWLPHGEGDSAGEDHGYKAFYDSVDALVMGRKTYEKVRTFGEWPFGSKPVVVLSSKKLKIPPKLVRSVSVMSGSVKDIVARLNERGIRHVYVDGGVTIQRFLEAGAIQRLIVTLIPVLIGQGIPLFGKLKRDIQLRHVATRQYDSGLVQSEYQVVA